MQEINFDEAVDLILTRDVRFSRDAYTFVREALDYTQKLIGKETPGVKLTTLDNGLSSSCAKTTARRSSRRRRGAWPAASTRASLARRRPVARARTHAVQGHHHAPRQPH
jgi:hypothetical protein